MSAILPGLQAFSSAFNRIAMKKLLYILAGLGLAACTSDIEELPEVGPQPGREVALTGISGTASRTQFVPGDGTEIQFQWSTGDRIWAGGVQSAEAGTDGNVADFGFTNLPGAAPYRIYYNMTGTDAEAVVPTEQRQAEPGKLQLGPNGDFGYATTDSEGRFTLSHATAYVWFNPWSQDVKEKLVSVTLAATDASTVLTGTRTFDGTGFSDATDANNAVTLSFGKEGVELPATSSTASVFAAAVVYPADCSAEEIHVTYTFADGSVYTETKTGRNFEAGRIYRLTTEITKRDGGSLEIQGLEDSDEPVCMKYGASEAYALTAGGWIPTVEMTSAPAGWTADFDIARRSLLIAPPAEYTDGMDLENTVTIQSDDKPILSQEYYVLDFTHPEGTFVLIEGNMTSENGTIVYFDQHMRYHEKVYEEINDNEIGNVLQDMYLANGKIYFITQNGKTSSMGTTFNGDGRFVVCDAHTMKRLVARDMPFYANVDTSTGATQSSKSTLCWPQHIVVVSPEKAYIQYSTADNESHSGIRIVDLQTNIIRTSDIPGTFGVFTKTGATKARMIFSRGKVFAGRGNSVIVLDPATDAVVKTITYENRQVKDLAKGYDGKIYAIFTGEFTGDSGMTGATEFTKPAMIVALDANGEVVSETNLPEQIELRTGTASPTVQMCASFTQPHLYFIGKQDFSAYEAMRYNYETGRVNWDYITAALDAESSGGSIIYGYMGVHPTTEQLWVGKSSYTNSRIHVYDVSRSDALEFSSFYQKKASPAGVDFAYRFSDEWINKRNRNLCMRGAGRVVHGLRSDRERGFRNRQRRFGRRGDRQGALHHQRREFHVRQCLALLLRSGEKTCRE